MSNKENGNEKIRTAINEGLESAREVISDHAAKFKEKIDDLELSEMPDELKSYVRKKPWTSLAIAVGLGFLAGYILKSNNKD